ncbi:MAG: hypothetical protein PHP69_05030 [Candidatus Omnitrophica bacterium]|jgi:cell division protein FtsB|nr:hypothetical protein [Candidatus Omnitrophota bacterium]MDD5080367.1 hypothetical protein [Candidatus Omnitrophota bacterium]MDD5440877.1 hypothetical protein [Candidatus Omnitrophota bacterium]
MKVSLVFTSRLFIVLVCFILIGFIYLPNYAKICKLKKAREELKLKADKVISEIDMLSEDISYEQMARDELDAVKKDETVIYIVRD